MNHYDPGPIILKPKRYLDKFKKCQKNLYKESSNKNVIKIPTKVVILNLYLSLMIWDVTLQCTDSPCFYSPEGKGLQNNF